MCYDIICWMINSSNYYDSYGFSHKHLLEDSVAVESISGMVNQQLQLLEVICSRHGAKYFGTCT